MIYFKTIPRPPRQQGANQLGFVLPLALVIIVILLFAAALYSNWSAKMVKSAQKSTDRVSFEVESKNTFSRLIYYLLAGEKMPEGMEVVVDPKESDTLDSMTEKSTMILRFDNRCYETELGIRFSLQDENGLLGVAQYQRQQLSKFLTNFEVPWETQSGLFDKLDDYQDVDDLLRLNGAEASDYRRANKKPPPNNLLYIPLELYNVFDWDKLGDLWANVEFTSSLTVYRAAYPNFNTAPKAVLMSITGIDENLASAIIVARENASMKTLSELEQLVEHNFQFDSFGLSFFPAKYVRISLWKNGLGTMKRYLVMITPYSTLAPWEIESLTILPKQDDGNATCEKIENIF